ncbi:hypothetical protein EWE75_18650 [Sphingomonas populi]|uniref:Uncharacterized protein n=1 Tax=Sphingomonas populi TaxID=2484750 RepID=A0A4Q6XUA6_9SPHN|nr:hypothetical protein [Sphingomonas populi]RZF61212.1 hypothetical protein EWE75_18650 [Sphingomonas populi]
MSMGPAAAQGTGSGTTKVDQLNSDMTKFRDYETRIKAGDTTVDQTDFSNLAKEIFSLTQDVDGSATPEAQAIFAELTNTAQALSDLITKTFNADAAAAADGSSTVNTTNTDAAIATMQNALVSQLTVQTGYAAQAAASLATIAGGSSTNTLSAPKINSRNGGAV